MQGYYGGLYASNFNQFDKQYRVMVQPSTASSLQSISPLSMNIAGSNGIWSKLAIQLKRRHLQQCRRTSAVGLEQSGAVRGRSARTNGAMEDEPPPHLGWLLTHFTTGPFLRETGPAQPITYAATWISFIF